MRLLFACLLCLAGLTPARGETYPFDGRQPLAVPQFAVGCPVEWADGSRGRIVEPARWREAAPAGEWFYVVQFGGSDSLRWLLPESGLQLLDEP